MILRSMPLVLMALAPIAVAEAPSVPPALPGTQPLDWPETEHAAMADRLMDGAHRYVDRRIAEAMRHRPRYWERDLTGGREAYEASVQPNRDELRRIIGVVETRVPVAMERFGDCATDPSLVAASDAYAIHQVRWPVLQDGLAGVWGEGLLVEPRGRSAGRVIVVPDADQTPEQLMGLADAGPPARSAARRLAEQGFTLLIPTLVDRQELDAQAMDIPEPARMRLGRQSQTHREWLYRQSYHMGRHVIGYEVQKILAAVDWLKQSEEGEAKVGVAGYGEGGLIAFYAAAADTTIDAVLVSGYFDSRESTWTEPNYRNVWARLEQFGDAELATLIAPRGMVIEHSSLPEITGSQGTIHTPALPSVRDELGRIASLIPEDFQPRVLVHGPEDEPIGPGSAEALDAFLAMLGADEAEFRDAGPAEHSLAGPPLTDRRPGFDPAARQLRQVQQIESHVQRLVRQSVYVRDRYYGHRALPALGDNTWSTVVFRDTLPPEPFIEASKRYRAEFHEQVQGRFDDALRSPNARTRLIYNTDAWAGYDVVLDVFDDLVAWGVLVLPHDVAPGERRPVVVVQHGRNGLPENLIVRDHTAYRRAAAQIAERGFIAFVPHNLYRTEERYRPLNRKANTVKATHYSFLVHQHDQILRWLNTLDFVDGERIAFYGNSFGGESALRIPSVLEGYAVSISASYFNQWARKVAGTEDHFSYLFTDEWEVPVFNAGHTFDHAELGYLMVPRPFMVERGHHDHVAHDTWVAHEYARVRRLYAMLGLGDRTEIEFFHGGHGMRLEGTLRFLHRHLDWPAPEHQQ